MAAAADEFSAYGVAGARIDRIAKTAKANKSQIYEYFGNKDELFLIVLKNNLADIYDSIDFDPYDLPEYAGLLFDFAMDHPKLMRLVMWNGLEQERRWPLDERSSLTTQVRKISEAQAEGRVAAEYSADFLLTLIVSIASAWTAANPFGMSITPDALAKRSVLRGSITNMVRVLCAL